ncbi:hypothetical protein JCGZ_11143 [Jatropha curcas]|uniref:Uncharacterized protein n=1 Tax=Jatropha curcas TaxID=180498 RepID=A0A067KQQ9_JATCU|nr:hypothetical protein JCGZ_11143 [Jatropha curcas]
MSDVGIFFIKQSAMNVNNLSINYIIGSKTVLSQHYTIPAAGNMNPDSYTAVKSCRKAVGLAFFCNSVIQFPKGCARLNPCTVIVNINVNRTEC